ncbi:MAG: DUF6477 family protein [Pseudomonadota bacterium]
MLDLMTRVTQLKRPALLARAARFGMDDYRRDVHLRPILGTTRLPASGPALMQLLDLESEVEMQRQRKTGIYRPVRHVALLIAIAGEARLLRALRAGD